MHRQLFAFAMIAASGSAVAADMLPLKQGIYVPVGRACKGASNADMLNYWGGNHAIGDAGGECTIRKMKRAGAVFTIDQECRDLAGNVVNDEPTAVRISSPTGFVLSGTHYRYCGPKVQW